MNRSNRSTDRLYSSMRFEGDGVTTRVPLTFDLRKGDGLAVDFGEGLVTEGYIVDFEVTPTVVIFKEPLPKGKTVTIRRLVYIGKVKHVFQWTGNAQGGADFSALNLDENFEQIVRASQDAMDAQMLATETLEEMAGIKEAAIEAQKDSKQYAKEAEAISQSIKGVEDRVIDLASKAEVAATASKHSADDAEKWAKEAEAIAGFDPTNYRKKDDLVFEGLMQVHAPDDKGTGLFFIDDTGKPRGQVTSNPTGLQFAQYLDNNTVQTFTLPHKGGELALRNNDCMLFASLASDNSWKAPYWTLEARSKSVEAPLYQGVCVDSVRGFLYAHHNEGDTGYVTRYIKGAQGVLTSESMSTGDTTVGHSGMAVEQETGMCWIDTKAVPNSSMRFKYVPDGDFTQREYYQFGDKAGKVAISYDQEYIVWSRRSSTTIYLDFFDLKEVVATGGGDVRHLRKRSVEIPNNPDIYYQSHGFDGTYIYIAGNLTTDADQGQLHVYDIEGNVLMSLPEFNVGNASVNVDQGQGTHWEIESLDFIELVEGGGRCVMFSIAGGKESGMFRNKIYMFGVGSNMAGVYKDRPIVRGATAVFGDVASLQSAPKGFKPKVQQHGTTDSATKQLWASWSSNGDVEAGRVIIKSNGGVIGTHGDLNANDNIYEDAFFSSYGGEWVKSGRYLVEVDGIPEKGYVPVRHQWATQGTDGDIFTAMSLNKSGTLIVSPDKSQHSFESHLTDTGDHFKFYRKSKLISSIYTTGNNVTICGRNGSGVILGSTEGEDSVRNLWALDGGTATFRPAAKGEYDLGATNYTIKDVYLLNNPTVTSDARSKFDIDRIDEKYMRVMSRLNFKQFKLKEGTSGRTHFGIIAQEWIEACEAEGVDPVESGVLVGDVDVGYAIRYAELQILHNAYVLWRLDTLEV